MSNPHDRHHRVSKGVPTGGQFAASAKPEANVALIASHSAPHYDITRVYAGSIRPGDQVRVRGRDEWVEVDRLDRVEFAGSPWDYIARCANGYQKGLRIEEDVEVVRGDENGIPALTDTIWNARMSVGYDSGKPQYVDWCDRCAEHQGHSTSADDGPTRELCHGCEDRKINEHASNGGNQ